MATKAEVLYEHIDEVEQIIGQKSTWNNKHYIYYKQNSDNLTIPDNLYIEVVSTATKGTIGKLVDIEFDTTSRRDKDDKKVEVICEYDSTFIIEIEGRKKPSRIAFQYSKILTDYTGQTKWIRQVKKTAPIKNPVNKFGQELKEGDWIIGVGKSKGSNKPLRFGRVTRWTKSSVWASMNYDLPKNERDEFQLNSISQTFLLPESNEHVDDLMMAIVKGWDGS